jgi:heat shock protein beta
VQHVFSSSADETSFEIFPDPRGNTLGRGTEITLYLKQDAVEYLEVSRIMDLVFVLLLFAARLLLTFYSNKHSSYSSSFPIYVFTQKTDQVPDEDVSETSSTPTSDSTLSDSSTSTPAEMLEENEDQAIVEEITGDEEKKIDTPAPPKMKSVVVDEWVQLNAQPPLWTRFVPP